MNRKIVKIVSLVILSLAIFAVVYYLNVLQASFTEGRHIYLGQTVNWRNVAIDSTGQPWVSESAGDVCVLKRFENNSWTTYPDKCGKPVFDADGNLWIAGSGLAKYDGKNWEIFNTNNSGIASDEIVNLAVDHQGRIWIVYDKNMPAVTVFDGTTWTSYSPSNSGLPSNEVSMVAFDSKNRAWFATDEGVSVLDGQQWFTYTSGLASKYIESIAFDKENRVWIGMAGDNCGVNMFDGMHWKYYSPDEMGFRDDAGIIGYDVRIDEMGRVWVWEYNNELRIFDHGVWFGINEKYIPSEVDSITPDQLGNIWVSIVGGELIKLDKDYHIPSNFQYQFVEHYQAILLILASLILLILLDNKITHPILSKLLDSMKKLRLPFIIIIPIYLLVVIVCIFLAFDFISEDTNSVWWLVLIVLTLPWSIIVSIIFAWSLIHGASFESASIAYLLSAGLNSFIFYGLYLSFRRRSKKRQS